MALKHLNWVNEESVGWIPPPGWTVFRLGVNGGQRDDTLEALRNWLNSQDVPGLYTWRLSVPQDQADWENTQWEHTLEVAMSDRDAAFETKMRFG